MVSSTKLRVVIDTNVLISGIVFKGNPKKVLNRWLQKKFILFISPEILLEFLTVLARFEVPAAIINKYKGLLESHAQRMIPKSNFKICRDPKDNQFLDLCFACQVDYLITGDKDLLALKTFRKTRILKPEAFLKKLKSGII